MKKILLTLVVLFITSRAYAGWFELAEDIVMETKVTILETATPAYFYDLGKGESNAGVKTDIITYRYLSGDGGWMNPFDANKVGSPVLGGSFHVDKFFSEFFPNTKILAKLMVPYSATDFWKRVSLGFSTGYDFDTKNTVYGISTGLKFDFKD